VTETFNKAFCEQDLSVLNELIRENHRLLTHIGVVPSKVQSFITELEQTGAAAKICGSGAVKGDNAGTVMVLSEDELSLLPICKRYGYEMTTVSCETRGLHVA